MCTNGSDPVSRYSPSFFLTLAAACSVSVTIFQRKLAKLELLRVSKRVFWGFTGADGGGDGVDSNCSVWHLEKVSSSEMVRGGNSLGFLLLREISHGVIWQVLHLFNHVSRKNNSVQEEKKIKKLYVYICIYPFNISLSRILDHTDTQFRSSKSSLNSMDIGWRREC